MRIALGILLLIGGVAYPMATLFWLNRRMARSPTLTSRQVTLLLALSGVLPVSLIFWGLSLLVPRLGAGLTVRMIIAISTMAVLALLAGLRLAQPGSGTGSELPAPDGKTQDGR